VARSTCTIQIDDLGSSEEECATFVELDEGGRLKLASPTSLTSIPGGSTVSVHGFKLADTLVVDGDSAINVTSEALAVAALSSVGPQRTLVLLVNYLDDRSEPITVAAMQQRFFVDVNNWDLDVSYGRT